MMLLAQNTASGQYMAIRTVHMKAALVKDSVTPTQSTHSDKSAISDEALMAGPLDDYEYGSLPALFDNKT